MMSAEGDEDGAAVSLTSLDTEHRRATEEDRIDLDYDEDVSNDVPCDDTKSVHSENGEKPEADAETKDVDDEKEEGELEEGELTSSDDEPAPVINKDVSSSKAANNVSISVRLTFPNKRVSGRKGSSNKGINSRLTKVSNGKPGETAWERGLREAREAMRRANKVREEPDFEVKRLVAAPSVRRNSRNNTDSDNSTSPVGRRRNHSRSGSPRGIPSLLDLPTAPPPRRVPPKDLGPQVIYPHGRPCPKRDREPEREHDRDRRDRGRRRDISPPRRDRENFPRKKDNKEKSKNNNEDVKHRKISISISPISSDSDLSPGSQKKSAKGCRSDLSAVNDPWARKRKGKIEKFERKKRSSSSSSSASSNSSRSTFTGRRKPGRSSTSSSELDSDTDKRKKYGKKISPRRSESNRRGTSSNKKIVIPERNPVDEFFSKKKSDLPAAFKKRSRKRSSSVSCDDKGIVAVSGSESERSISTVSSAGSSPKIFAKPRPKEKSPSPISDDSKSSPSPPPPPLPKFEDISPPPPPSKKMKVSNDSRVSEKRKLMEQLREVEEELEKRRAVHMETAH